VQGRGLVRQGWFVPAEAAGIIVFAIVTGVLITWRAFGGVVAALALFAIYAAGSQLAFAFHGIVTSLVYPLIVVTATTISGLGYQYATEARQRKWVRNAFERYVGGEVADLLAREPERLGLHGEKRELSILFTDIRGFSTLSEKLTPEDLADLLTEHLGSQTTIVFEHKGFLDKYIGDAVMAVLGCAAPHDRARASRPAAPRSTSWPRCLASARNGRRAAGPRSTSASASTPATRSSATSARRSASATRRSATT
jgi:adenylate cyclase